MVPKSLSRTASMIALTVGVTLWLLGKVADGDLAD